MPLPSDYVGTGITFPLKVMGPRGVGFKQDNGTVAQLSVSSLVKASFVDPAAKVTNGIVTSHAGAGAAGTTTRTPNGSLSSGGVATLLPARNVVITVTHATAVVAMSGTITGTRLGRAVTEAWSVTAGTASKTFTGAVAFDTVTSITETIAADASANTIIAGSGDKLGLTFKASAPNIVGETEDGAIPTAGTLVVASTSANADARGTYAPNSVPNAALDYVVWYISDDLTAIY